MRMRSSNVCINLYTNIFILHQWCIAYDNGPARWDSSNTKLGRRKARSRASYRPAHGNVWEMSDDVTRLQDQPIPNKNCINYNNNHRGMKYSDDLLFIYSNCETCARARSFFISLHRNTHSNKWTLNRRKENRNGGHPIVFLSHASSIETKWVSVCVCVWGGGRFSCTSSCRAHFMNGKSPSTEHQQQRQQHLRPSGRVVNRHKDRTWKNWILFVFRGGLVFDSSAEQSNWNTNFAFDWKLLYYLPLNRSVFIYSWNESIEVCGIRCVVDSAFCGNFIRDFIETHTTWDACNMWFVLYCQIGRHGPTTDGTFSTDDHLNITICVWKGRWNISAGVDWSLTHFSVASQWNFHFVCSLRFPKENACLFDIPNACE